MSAGTEYFHNLSSYFYIFSPTEFFGYRISLLLSGKQCGHSYRISHKALFSQQAPLPSFGASVHRDLPAPLFRT